MLPSPATERRTFRNVGPGPQLMSCEAQRDLIFARVRVKLFLPRLNQRNRADAAHRTGILKPLRVYRPAVCGVRVGGRSASAVVDVCVVTHSVVE